MAVSVDIAGHVFTAGLSNVFVASKDGDSPATAVPNERIHRLLRLAAALDSFQRPATDLNGLHAKVDTYTPKANDQLVR